MSNHICIMGLVKSSIFRQSKSGHTLFMKLYIIKPQSNDLFIQVKQTHQNIPPFHSISSPIENKCIFTLSTKPQSQLQPQLTYFLQHTMQQRKLLAKFLYPMLTVQMGCCYHSDTYSSLQVALRAWKYQILKGKI